MTLLWIGATLLIALSMWMGMRSGQFKARRRALKNLPDNITLVRVPGDQWQEPTLAEWLAAPLRPKGFVDLGVYHVLPFSEVKLGVMLNEKDKVAAFICERSNQPMSGTTLELNVRYADGSITMLVNHPDNGVPKPPFCRVIFAEPDASSADLFERLLRERSGIGIRTITPENVLPEYQAAWTKIMRWEKGRGLTEEEARCIARGGPKTAESQGKAIDTPPAMPAPAQDIHPGDVRCPHCGQPNEKEREVCWACHQLLCGEKPPAYVSIEQPEPGPGTFHSFMDFLVGGCVGGTLVVLGVLFIARFWGPARDDAFTRKSQSAQAEGTVVEARRHYVRGGDFSYTNIKISFTTASGQQVTFKTDLSRKDAGPGAKFPVRYDPQLPANCNVGIAGEPSKSTFNVLLYGGGMILAGILIWVWKFPFLRPWWLR